MSQQSVLSRPHLSIVTNEGLPGPGLIEPKGLLLQSENLSSEGEPEVAEENYGSGDPSLSNKSLPKAAARSSTQKSFAEAENKRSTARTEKQSSRVQQVADSEFLGLSFDERQKYCRQRQKAREESIALVMLTEEQEECTFAPLVKESLEASGSKRTLKKFLMDQERFKESRAAKVQLEYNKQRQRELKEMQEAPKINPKSALITDKSGITAGCHERLYSMEKENRTSAVTKCSDDSVSTKQQRSREQQTKDEVCVRNKISRELTKICVDCNGNTSDKIKYASLYKLLQKYGMLTEKDDRGNSQRKLVVKLWALLEGEVRGGISFETLKSVVFSIMRSTQAQTAPEARLKCNPDLSHAKPTYGKFAEDTFVVSFSEAEALHKLFKPLYLNKMGQQKQAAKAEKYSHKPKLGDATLKMTSDLKERRKEMMLRKKEHTNICLGHKKTPSMADLLAVDREEKEKEFETYKRKVEAERARECTFRPSIHPGTSNKAGTELAGDSRTRCRSLYKLSRSGKAQRKQNDRTTEEVEFEKQKGELTFTPSLHKRTKSEDVARHQRSGSNIKAYQSSVERLTKARKERQLVEMAKTMGLTFANAQSKLQGCRNAGLAGASKISHKLHKSFGTPSAFTLDATNRSMCSGPTITMKSVQEHSVAGKRVVKGKETRISDIGIDLEEIIAKARLEDSKAGKSLSQNI